MLFWWTDSVVSLLIDTPAMGIVATPLVMKNRLDQKIHYIEFWSHEEW